MKYELAGLRPSQERMLAKSLNDEEARIHFVDQMHQFLLESSRGGEAQLDSLTSLATRLSAHHVWHKLSGAQLEKIVESCRPDVLIAFKEGLPSEISGRLHGRKHLAKRSMAAKRALRSSRHRRRKASGAVKHSTAAHGLVDH
ncbi:hypothetical protein [Pyruvatibacter mobilis]|uniref:hypothetical protein n=1 Tax=Pyruvatibacter mobilis TaxID=1712261 RepID=UPI003BAA4416